MIEATVRREAQLRFPARAPRRADDGPRALLDAARYPSARR